MSSPILLCFYKIMEQEMMQGFLIMKQSSELFLCVCYILEYEAKHDQVIFSKRRVLSNLLWNVLTDSELIECSTKVTVFRSQFFIIMLGFAEQTQIGKYILVQMSFVVQCHIIVIIVAITYLHILVCKTNTAVLNDCCQLIL